MARSRNDILQGTHDLLVLLTLSVAGPLHGYAITAQIHRASAELLRVEEGSLYPALHRMEQEGWLRSSWGTTEKNREARFYEITAKGRKQLDAVRESWAKLTDGVSRLGGSTLCAPAPSNATFSARWPSTFVSAPTSYAHRACRRPTLHSSRNDSSAIAA